MRIFRKKYIVGLDIGASSIKFTQFIEKDGNPSLIKAEVREVAYTQDEKSIEREMVSALKDLLKGVDIKNSKFTAAINCPETDIKRIMAPCMPKNELKDALTLSAKDYFHFPIEESILQFEILDDVIVEGSRKYEVVAAVSPKKTVERYVSLLKKAGIVPNLLVPSSYALQKTAARVYAKDRETRCFVDIGQLYTELIILQGKNLVFSRRLPVAGDDFTKAMTGALVSDIGKTQLSLEEAEKIKREIGMPAKGESKIIGSKISTDQILSMLWTPAEQLVGEIERSFDYFREEIGGKVNSVLLFGGGGILGGLMKFLSERLGVEVKLGDALEGIETQPGAIQNREKISYRLAGAIGAALSLACGINLLPPELKYEAKRTFRRTTYEALAAAVIVILAAVYIGMNIQLGNFQKRISAAKMELGALEPQLKEAAAQSLVSRILENEQYWQDVFKELGNIVPDNICIDSVSKEKNVIKIRGVAAGSGKSLVSNFILSLEKGLFSKVTLSSLKESKDKDMNEFELTCRIDLK